MKVNSIKLGYLQTNCYLLNQNNEYLLIDPGEELEKIEKFIKGKNIIGIITTHSHMDHTESVEDLVNKYHYKVYNNKNLSEGINKIGNFTFELIKTYGHTMDSITIYFKEEKIMITGDFLFKDTIGRCDLKGGNYQKMKKSINKIKKYDDDITIYPGHGDITNLGYEKINNPYFK